jgi:3-hydroxybutyryl-CoA dehydrogenase
MKIAAIGNERSKMELASARRSPELEWVWVGSVPELHLHPDAILYADLEFTMDKARILQLSALLPKPVLIHSVTHTLREIGHPFIRINGWPGFLGRNPAELALLDHGPTVDLSPARNPQASPDPQQEAEVRKLFENLGWPCRIVPDIPGMLSGRILAAIINEAYFTLEQEVSTKEGIDEAMRLGTSYPYGPFEWGQKIGIAAIHELLEALSGTDTGYTAAGTLIREARAASPKDPPASSEQTTISQTTGSRD